MKALEKMQEALVTGSDAVRVPIYAGKALALDAEVRALRIDNERLVKAPWHEGYPTKFYAEEWFIARLDNGDKVVLRALPEEWSYDFKTADDTYYKKDRVVKWMQFPESQYLPPTPPALDQGQAKAKCVCSDHDLMAVPHTIICNGFTEHPRSAKKCAACGHSKACHAPADQPKCVNCAHVIDEANPGYVDVAGASGHYKCPDQQAGEGVEKL